MHISNDSTPAGAMTAEEASDFITAAGDIFYVIQGASRSGGRLAGELRGGRKADPNVGPAIRTVEALERQLEALAMIRNLPRSPEPDMPRPLPAEGDLPAMLSDAGRDARYVKHLTQGGGGMAIGSNVAEALRVVRALRPKLEAIWSIYETMPKPVVRPMTGAEQEAFWRRMDAIAEEARLG